MPTPIPTPSNGALRTLRNLALGTSCTVAFSAGVLAEDRRRRIHAAREVHGNAKKLKSSRKYHSAGLELVETFETQAIRHGDGNFWWTPEQPEQPEASTVDLPILEHPPKKIPVPMQRYTLHPAGTTLRKWKPTPPNQVPWHPVKLYVDQKPQDRQISIASDILRRLEGNSEDATEEAVLRFLEVFEEGVDLGQTGLAEDLLNAAIQLSNACIFHGKHEKHEKVLDVIIKCGPIDEEVFFSFNPQAIIRIALNRKQDHPTGSKILDEGRLRRACILYLTEFKEPMDKTGNTESWARLGLKLSIESCRRNLFDLSEKIYWRLNKMSFDMSIPALKHLLTAVLGQGDCKRATKYFRRFYLQTTPSQVDFYLMVKALTDAALESVPSDFELAEEISMLAFQMAEQQQLKVSTSGIMKIMGTHWRAYRNIAPIEQMFKRLEPHLPLVSHPQAVYGSLIQFYVESNDEASAIALYEKMRATYSPAPGDVRIYGHFAYCKAMRKDWQGVKTDFLRMKDLRPEADGLVAAFGPIFSLFAKSESVGDTEKFLHDFTDGVGIQLTQHTSKVMIEKYLEAKEIMSVARWLDYIRDQQVDISSTFFNSILNACYKQWMFSFEEVYKLYLSVKKLGTWTKAFINHETYITLRHIAISASEDKVDTATARLTLLDMTQSGFVLNHRNVLEKMATEFARGDFQDVLNTYNLALSERIPLNASAVRTAIRASLRLHPNDIDATAALLRKSSRNGQDISGAFSSIFLSQYANAATDCSSIEKVARDTIEALDRQNMRVPLTVVTHTMSILCRTHKYRASIDFWDSVSRIHALTIDMPTLTVLLQAYLGLEDPVGLRWIIQMLEVNAIIPDRRIKFALKNGRRRAKNWEFLETVTQTLEIVMQMRGVAMQDKESVKVKTITMMEKAMQRQG